MVDHHNPNMFLKFALKEDTPQVLTQTQSTPHGNCWGGPSAGFTPCQLVQAAEQAEKDVLREKEVMQFCCWAVACLERMVSTCFCVVFWCFLHSGIGISPKCVFWWGTMFFGTIWYYFRRRVPRYCSSWNSSTSESSAQDKRYPPLTHGFPKGREKGAGWAFFINDGQPAQRRNSSVLYTVYIYILHICLQSAVSSQVYITCEFSLLRRILCGYTCKYCIWYDITHAYLFWWL